MMIGLDWANMDGNSIVNLKAAYGSGARFVYLRRGYSYGSPGKVIMAHDATYASQAQAVRDAGMVVGAYLFPSFNVGAPTPAEQVANFISGGGDIKPGVDLPPCLDIEFPGKNGLPDTGHSQSEVLGLIIQFVAEMRKQLGCQPVIYTSHVQMCDSNGLGLTSPVPELVDCPYWAKTPYRLGAGNPPDQIVPNPPHVGSAFWDKFDYWRVPATWEKSGYWMQQYQGDARGFAGIHQADLSLFNPLSAKTAAFDPRWQWLGRVLGQPGAFPASIVSTVMAQQSSYGLTNDGIVGPATFAALAWMNK